MNATSRLDTMKSEVTMSTQTNGRRRFDGARRAVGGVRTRVSEAVAHVPEVVGYARNRAGQAADGLPTALGHVRSGAHDTVTRLQIVPDSSLRLMAAVSVGFGAGLHLAGKTRLAKLAGFVPASLFGFAIFSRPQPVPPKSQPVRP